MACCCRHKKCWKAESFPNMYRFLEPAILMALLQHKKLHGYNLLEKIRPMLPVCEKVDKGGLYRLLRSMEESEWIASEWLNDGSGPSKRCYILTNKGVERSKIWNSFLIDFNQRMSFFQQELQDVIDLEKG